MYATATGPINLSPIPTRLTIRPAEPDPDPPDDPPLAGPEVSFLLQANPDCASRRCSRRRAQFRQCHRVG